MTQQGFPAALRPEIAAMEPSRIVQLWELGFEREDVIPLWVGESDLGTPEFINRAAYAALQAGRTFYSHKRGIPALVEGLAAYSSGLYGREIDRSRVTVTSSGMHAIAIILQALLEPGDEILVIEPTWPNVVSAARIAHGEVRFLALDPLEEGGFALDTEKLKAACGPRTRALFINSPSNPTGWMMEREQQQEILEFCRERRIWIMADEVYARLVYDRPVAPSFLEIAEPDDPVIQINSFSKTWAMTGWRLGWLVHPPSMGPVFSNMIEFSSSGAQGFLQEGAVAALGPEGEDFAREMIERCRRGGEIVYQRLAGLPRVAIARPTASFYAFFRVEGMEDSLEFAKRILRETGVGLAPGSAFGQAGEGHLRLCYASSPERLSAAMDRVEPILS
ncbi:MAG: pyridoxal phosphate-dependent aminotransferase [Limibacillus sp.]